jgi:hypothetical protein
VDPATRTSVSSRSALQFSVQRQAISAQAAEEAMQQRGGQFAQGAYQIVTPWGDDPDLSNCHGYTIHQVVDRSTDGGGLMAGIGAQDPVAVFVRNGQIAHSGRYQGNQLTHFLIGIGVVRSTLEPADTAGYDARFNLPGDRQGLDGFLAAAAEEEEAEERRGLVGRILGYAQDYGVEGQAGVTMEAFDGLEWDDDKDDFIDEHLVEINRIRGVLVTDHDVPADGLPALA